MLSVDGDHENDTFSSVAVTVTFVGIVGAIESVRSTGIPVLTNEKRCAFNTVTPTTSTVHVPI